MISSSEQIRQLHENLKREGQMLAGGLKDLPQRATTYRHVYRESGGNHIFPLIAAHGALWAKGYFEFGMNLGRKLSLQYLGDPKRQHAQVAALERFADAFREINRLVCVDTYANYHLVKELGPRAELAEVIPVELLDALRRVHHARERGKPLSDLEKRSVFRAHFLYEQEYVVGPRVQDALDEFDWPLVKWIALKPLVQFAYFPRNRFFWFGNFAERTQRIERGLLAFDLAAKRGWQQVECDLEKYDLLPREFFEMPTCHFETMRESILTVG